MCRYTSSHPLTLSLSHFVCVLLLSSTPKFTRILIVVMPPCSCQNTKYCTVTAKFYCGDVSNHPFSKTVELEMPHTQKLWEIHSKLWLNCYQPHINASNSKLLMSIKHMFIISAPGLLLYIHVYIKWVFWRISNQKEPCTRCSLLFHSDCEWRDSRLHAEAITGRHAKLNQYCFLMRFISCRFRSGDVLTIILMVPTSM